MNKQLIIGFATEGNTDNRFLESIIQRTFEKAAFECEGSIEVFPVQCLSKVRGDFLNVVKTYCVKADSQGIMVLCIHCDSDEPTDVNVFNNKINPAFNAVFELKENDCCTNLVAVVPVVMTEAWMMADMELLKEEIGTQLDNKDLGLSQSPEKIRNPKQTIENAIRTARQTHTKRRRRDITISDLYIPLGQKIKLKALEELPSYNKFMTAVMESLRQLGYLRDK